MERSAPQPRAIVQARAAATHGAGRPFFGVVLAMNTTVNGRLDDPFAWFVGVAEDLYGEINRGYETFDTILVGRVTYEEMAAY
jgi:hypothetical protein